MMDYQLFEAGYCTHCQRMTLKTGHLKHSEYPALCALIKHPVQGYVLFDTGYSERFHALTQKFPFSLYRRLTPVVLKKTLKEQLEDQGISATEIRWIVISHFHADHISGLRDFPNAQFICHPDAILDVRHKKGIKALLKGFLPGLLPDDFYERVVPLTHEVALDPSLKPFTQGFDLFADEQLLAVSLPGHAKGHIGLYFKAERPTFLIADSCWHQETFQELNYPSELTYLIHDDKKAYQETIRKLHMLYQNNKGLDIIPAHCQHIRTRFKDAF